MQVEKLSKSIVLLILLGACAGSQVEVSRDPIASIRDAGRDAAQAGDERPSVRVQPTPATAAQLATPQLAPPPLPTSLLRPNVQTTFSPGAVLPQVSEAAFVDPRASVIGAVEMGASVYVAPSASVRGDEGQPIHIGAQSNVQDGVVIHALETEEQGQTIPGNIVKVHDRGYAVFIGERVSLAHQSQVHGPALIGDNTFVGMQALVFRAEVGAGCVLEPRALVMGVKVQPGRYVPAGQVVTTQEEADALPQITAEYRFAKMNAGVLHVNHQLADGYRLQSGGTPDAAHAAGAQPATGKHTAARPASHL